MYARFAPPCAVACVEVASAQAFRVWARAEDTGTPMLVRYRRAGRSRNRRLERRWSRVMAAGFVPAIRVSIRGRPRGVEYSDTRHPPAIRLAIERASMLRD
jgi:hypothetical protein